MDWINMRCLAMGWLVVPLIVAGGCATEKSGILVMAHGGDEGWNREVEQAVAPLRHKVPVEIAFGMARSSTLQAAVRRLETQGVRRIAVVRLFISGDSFLAQTEYILGLRESLPQSHPTSGGTDGRSHMETPKPIQSSSSFVLSRRGLGDSPLVGEVLADRVRALSTDPNMESVLILAHGPGDEAENERWLANMRLRAQRIHEIGPFRHVQCETLREDWPSRRAEATRRIRRYVEEGSRIGGRVLVVPFRIASFGPYHKVLHDLHYVSDGRGFCPHPNITKWIEETAQRCFRGESTEKKEPLGLSFAQHIQE